MCFMADYRGGLSQGLPYRFVAKWLEASVAKVAGVAGVPIGFGLCSSSQNFDKRGI